jgi:DNA-binding NarL/FixJ family response regulator
VVRRIFLVDDHDVVRAGMKSVLDGRFDIVGEAGDVDTAVSGILATEPEMVVLDVKLPSGNGADVVRRVHETNPDLIDQAADGQKPVSADVAAFMLDIDEDIEAGTPIQRLTPREREVVNLIARGYSYRETAARLSISVKTLENHMGHIFEKLSVASRHELAALVYEEGLVDRDPS